MLFDGISVAPASPKRPAGDDEHLRAGGIDAEDQPVSTRWPPPASCSCLAPWVARRAALGVIERSRLRGETRLDREYDELGTVPRGEFHHCSADVGPHGRRAYHQLRRDLIVRPAGGDPGDDLPLAVGQAVQPGAVPPGGATANRSITRRVTDGDSSEPPSATTRTARTSSSGSASFST